MGSAERTRRCAICQAVYRGNESFCPIDGGAVVERVDATEDTYVGRTIDGRYLVHRRIGHGGMGVVYEAAHIGLDKRIAIKFLLGAADDVDALARFRREARVASKIDHDNVVNILDVGRDNKGTDYLAMELVDGRDLQQILASEGPFEPQRAVVLVRQILRGLAAIHDAGIVHRDLKPSNVVVVSGRDGEQAKIMDFGISKSMAATENITKTGNVIGTPQYMSPEQLLGEAVDPRSDIFAVGLILFALLAGEPPFKGSTMSRLAAMHATQEIPRLSTRRDDLPAALVEAVAIAVSRRREDRHASAGELERVLAAIDFGIAPTEQPDRWMQRTAKVAPAAVEAATKIDKPVAAAAPVHSRRALWLVIAAVVVGGAIAAVLVAMNRPASTTREAVAPSTMDAAIGSGSQIPDVLVLAQRAEVDGKLELAIALYEDAVRSSATPRPDLAFRLGELYERLGETAKAAERFAHYLELAPAVPDAVHVRARIARLSPVATPADAGVAAVATKPKRTPDAAIAAEQLRCYCFPGHGNDGSHFRLCRGLEKNPRCGCRGPVPGGSSEGYLCSKPGTRCSSPEPGCFDALKCDDPSWGKLTVAAKKGDPCTGYRHTGDLIQGTYSCAVCDADLGYIFKGNQGDACLGYAFTTGEPIQGHLNNCFR